MAITLYNMVLTSDKDKTGVFYVSIVDDPAIGEEFIKLNKELKLTLSDDDQQIITGLALIPDMPIFRRGVEGGEDYYIQFSKDTIKETANRFMANSEMSNVTLSHNGKTNVVNIVESWIVEDEQHDKLTALGLSAKVGGWALSMKIEDKKLWDEIRNSDIYSGFSIEGLFEKEAINQNVFLSKQVEAETNKKIAKLGEAVINLAHSIKNIY